MPCQTFTIFLQIACCSEDKLEDITEKAEVTYWPISLDWKTMGGTSAAAQEQPPIEESNDNSYWYRMSYKADCARFEHAFDYNSVAKVKGSVGHCSICPAAKLEKDKDLLEATGLADDDCDDKGRYHWKSFYAYGEKFSDGDAMFLLPHSSGANSSGAKAKKIFDLKKNVDEDRYPEVYRYKSCTIKGSNENCPKPFLLGVVSDITSADMEGKKKVKIHYRKLYRPEDTYLTDTDVFAKDLNLVYWSDDFISTDIANVRGKVTVRPECSLNQRLDEWTMDGTYRFYFKESYNRTKRCFEELTPEAELYGGQKGKGGGGKGKGGKTISFVINLILSFCVFILFRQGRFRQEDFRQERHQLRTQAGPPPRHSRRLCRRRRSLARPSSGRYRRVQVGH
jgi:DNA (cytosine-5)-methyltransferase 1